MPSSLSAPTVHSVASSIAKHSIDIKTGHFLNGIGTPTSGLVYLSEVSASESAESLLNREKDGSSNQSGSSNLTAGTVLV